MPVVTAMSRLFLKQRVQGWFPRFLRAKVSRTFDALMESWPEPDEFETKAQRKQLLKERMAAKGFPWSLLIEAIIRIVIWYISRDRKEMASERLLALRISNTRKAD